MIFPQAYWVNENDLEIKVKWLYLGVHLLFSNDPFLPFRRRI